MMPRSLAGAHLKALREHGPWDEPHLTSKHDGIGITFRGPGVRIQHRDVDNIIVGLVVWPFDRPTGKVREVLILAGK